MRTTIDLPPDLYAVARELARKQRMTLGEALVSLIRDGAAQSAHCKAVTANKTDLMTAIKIGHAVTAEDVSSLEDDELSFLMSDGSLDVLSR